MRTRMRKPVIFTLISTLAILLIFIEISKGLGGVEHEQLIDFIKIHQEVEDFNIDNLRLQDVSAIPVEVGGKNFMVETRQDRMTIKNCSACHEGPLDALKSKQGATVNVSFLEKKSHWDIPNPHGKAVNVNCTTCHNQEDVNRLNIGGNQTVGFDESFRTCALCHSKELRDWAGGAHGKRIGGWAGEKIINNCTTCHNPHSPLFTSRRPAIMSPPPTP